MEELLQQLIDRLTTLEDEFDSLPDLSIIQSMIKDIEALKQQDNLDSQFIKEQIKIFATGFFDNKSTELLSELRQSYEAIKKLNTDLIDTSKNELITKVNQDFTNLSNEFTSKYDSFKNALVKLSNEYQIELDDKVNNALAEINAKLKTVKNGIDGKDGAKGDKGDKGNDGLNGLDGKDGIGISNITYKLGNLIIQLSDNTTKSIKLNIPQMLGNGGGVSKQIVDNAISEALKNYYTKTEIQTMLPKVGFDTTNTITPNVGQLAWNIDDSTLDLGLNGATLQIGQESLVKVRNNYGSTITNGQVVMAVGTLGNSGRILVNPHTGLRSNAKQIVGIATEDILNGQDGFVTVFGKVRGINTTGSTVGENWNDGDILYLKPNDNGNLTKVTPSSSQVKMPIAIVIHAHTNGTLFVRISGVDENAFYDVIPSYIDAYLLSKGL